MNYVAYQYAEALFSLSFEENQVSDVLNQFQHFNNAMDEEIFKFFSHPKISKTSKKEIITNSVENDILKRFLFVLIDNSRIELINEILNEFINVVNKQSNVLLVNVYSSNKLSNEQIEDLKISLNKKNNRNIKLNNIIDSNIVGGLRIEYDGMIFDETINNYLVNMKASLTK